MLRPWVVDTVGAAKELEDAVGFGGGVLELLCRRALEREGRDLEALSAGHDEKEEARDDDRGPARKLFPADAVGGTGLLREPTLKEEDAGKCDGRDRQHALGVVLEVLGHGLLGVGLRLVDVPMM